MFKIIFVYKSIRTCIIGGINIDTLNFFTQALLQQTKSMKIVRIEKQTITLLIKLIDTSEQLFLEILIKKLCIDQEVFKLCEEIWNVK